MRLLWIDDEIDLLKPFVLGLQERGYQVRTATNGPDGLEMLRTGDFDLVLLDQMMSGMDGLEALRRIKDTDPNLLVTMVTKSDEEALVNEAYGEMVDDFLIKPFSLAQLLAVLKRLLEKRKLISERMGQQYSLAMNQPRDLSSWESWVDYYRSLVHWQTVLGRYGDAALKEVQQDRWQRADDEFARFVIHDYRDWVAGRGPTMSHRVIEEYVQPHWDEAVTHLFVLDSMRLDQWNAIAPVLRDFYEIDTRYYCAILPSATPYARNAIFSGLLPLEILHRYPRYWVFEESGQNRHEKELLAEFLHRLRFRDRWAFLKVATGEDLARERGVVLDSGVRFTVVVLNLLDQLVHSVKSTRLLDEMIPDDQALVGLTRAWFVSSSVFELMRALARQKSRVIVTSDHGFIRVQRPALIYGGREMSANLRYKYGSALRVDERKALLLRSPESYMLPAEHQNVSLAIALSDHYFIYPTKPKLYERTYKHSYQHGGVSLPEMIVPVATLRPR